MLLTLPLSDAPVLARTPTARGWLRPANPASSEGIPLAPIHSLGRIEVPIPAHTPAGRYVLTVKTPRFLSASCPAEQCDTRLRAQLIRRVTVE